MQSAESVQRQRCMTDLLTDGVVLQEVNSPKAWEPDPQIHSNVVLSSGRPDFEAILKGIQVSPKPHHAGLRLHLH